METDYTLRTLTPTGRPQKMRQGLIVQCGDIIAKGYMQPCSTLRGGRFYHWLEHRYFTSIRDAVTRTAWPADTLERHKASIHYLRGKLHKYCPGLVYRSLRMRQPLTKKILQQRMTYGKDMLALLGANSDALLDIHWMDECTIGWAGT